MQVHLQHIVGNLVQYYAGVVGHNPLHATFQPYMSRCRNIVDLLLFSSYIALLNGIVVYMYVSSAASKDGVVHSVTSLTIIQIILFLLPLVCVAVFLTVKLPILPKVTMQRIQWSQSVQYDRDN